MAFGSPRRRAHAATRLAGPGPAVVDVAVVLAVDVSGSVSDERILIPLRGGSDAEARGDP